MNDMTNRTLGLLFGIPVILILVAVALTLTLWPASHAVPMMGVAVPAASTGSAGFANRGVPVLMKGIVDTGIVPVPPPPEAGATAAEVDQKIIKAGSLDLVVDDVSSAVNRITAIATGKGGFVQDSNVSERDDGTHAGSMTIRVPADKFEETSTEVKKLATLVKSETATGQDVTEQYTDLQAHLKNAQAEEAAFLAILQQAKTIPDILAVEQQLADIRGQIESLQGQIKYLSNVTSYSTLTVSLAEEPAVNIPTKEFRPLTSAKEAVQALVAVFQNLAVTLIWVVIVGGGVLLPILLVAWLIVKLVQRKSRR
jgi:hypothetical protein